MPYKRRETDMKKYIWWILGAAIVFGAWWALWGNEAEAEDRGRSTEDGGQRA